MKESRLQRWALGAEIVGAVAVVLTLGYLALEMRENTNAIQAQTYQSMISELNEYRRGLWDTQMADVMTKFQTDGWEGLTLVEKRVRWSISQTRWGIYESAYFANQRGVLGSQEWTRFEAAFCRGYDQEREMWRTPEFAPNGIVSLLVPEFANYVESRCG